MYTLSESNCLPFWERTILLVLLENCIFITLAVLILGRELF